MVAKAAKPEQDDHPTRTGLIVRRDADRDWPGSPRYLAAMAARGRPSMECWPRMFTGGVEVLFHVKLRFKGAGVEAKAVGLYVDLEQPGLPSELSLGDATRREAAQQAVDGL